MKKIVLSFLTTFFLFNAYCQQGIKQDLNHVATITFPDTPKFQQLKVGAIYTVFTNHKLYIAQAAPVQKNLKDLLTRHLDDSIYQGAITGSLKQAKGKLIYKKKITAHGLTGIEFCYTSPIGMVNYYRYHQAFYFNSTLVLYGYWAPDSLKSDDKGLRDFFGTFKVTIKDSEIRQGNARDLGFKTGKIIGTLLFIAVIIAIGFGIVFIIKKITYK
ncbi:MAG: hypothetical protein M3O71_09020 [Bacteroidota bacterium]|nr:hypothetical protein [Bacteroidota bacterium]